MFSTDKQMGYQCFVSFFDLRDPSQIGAPRLGHRTGAEVRARLQSPGPDMCCPTQTAMSPTWIPYRDSQSHPVPSEDLWEMHHRRHEGGGSTSIVQVRWVRPTSIRMILCERQDEPGG